MGRLDLAAVAVVAATWAFWWLSQPVAPPSTVTVAAPSRTPAVAGDPSDSDSDEPAEAVAAGAQVGARGAPRTKREPSPTNTVGGAMQRSSPVVLNHLPSSASPAIPAAIPAATAAPVDPFPMPEVSVGRVKETARRFRANLPAGGRIPTRITVDEVLPREVIAGLGWPAETPLVELGSHGPDLVAGLQEVLDLPEDAQSLFGVTVTLPNGKQMRAYVRTNP